MGSMNEQNPYETIRKLRISIGAGRLIAATDKMNAALRNVADAATEALNILDDVLPSSIGKIPPKDSH